MKEFLPTRYHQNCKTQSFSGRYKLCDKIEKIIQIRNLEAGNSYIFLNRWGFWDTFSCQVKTNLTQGRML